MYYIKGTLEELFKDRAIVENGGIGYNMMITETTYNVLVAQGAYTASGEVSQMPVQMYTMQRIVDESQFEMFGFATQSELAMFKLLQTVSGIGTRAALSVLSVMTVEELCTAIASDDTKSISRAQGVGQKASQKICIDLAGKLEKFMLENGVGYSSVKTVSVKDEKALSDEHKLAAEALTNLGYTKHEAQSAVSKVTGKTAEEIIRKALQIINR